MAGIGCPESNRALPAMPPALAARSSRADWFAPEAAAFLAAPWVMMRGNHEVWRRGAEGWFRFLDPLPYQTPCQDVTEPYRVPFEGVNFVVLGSGIANDQIAHPAQVALDREQLARAPALAGVRAWLVTHRPLSAVGPFSPPGASPASNVTVGEAAPPMWPSSAELILSGHRHLWESLGFALSATGRPSQWVVGHGGTLLEPSFTLSFDGLPIAGEIASPESRCVTTRLGS